ncbi:MAG TPA: hypothetical protein VGE15_00825 [Sphingobacteriaceae bacterium]
MKSTVVLLLFTIGLVGSGCEETESGNLKGSFSGTFTAHGTPVTPEQSGPVQVTFDGNSYRSTSNPDRIPAGGSGTFRFADKTQIVFEDKNIWTADFSWGLILDGEYEYKFKGDSLYLTRYSDSGEAKVYEYKLKRDR